MCKVDVTALGMLTPSGDSDVSQAEALAMVDAFYGAMLDVFERFHFWGVGFHPDDDVTRVTTREGVRAFSDDAAELIERNIESVAAAYSRLGEPDRLYVFASERLRRTVVPSLPDLAPADDDYGDALEFHPLNHD